MCAATCASSRNGSFGRSRASRCAANGAMGGRVRQWITYHGLALNVHPELQHYRGIVPCGIVEHGVTSLAELGIAATMEEVDTALSRTFAEVFEVPPVCGP